MLTYRFQTNNTKVVAHANSPHTDDSASEPLDISVSGSDGHTTEELTNPPPSPDSADSLPSFDLIESCSTESCAHSSDSSETLGPEVSTNEGVAPTLMENLPIPPTEPLLGAIVVVPFALYALRRQFKS